MALAPFAIGNFPPLCFDQTPTPLNAERRFVFLAIHLLVMASLPNSRQDGSRRSPSSPGGIMEHMRQIAFATAARACGFGSLAIFCVMIGLSFEPRAAFQAGGFLTTLMAAVLIFKAHEARTKNYRKTEMWLYLPKEVRPPEAYAQWASSTVLRETYLTFAKWTSVIAIAMWVLALGFSLLGR
jgi:hypothetical protein